MFKMRHPLPGTAPATLIALQPGEGVPPSISLMEYDQEGVREASVRSVAELPSAPAEGKVLWIEFNGLGDIDELKALGEKFDLHPLALEDIIHSGQRPKMEPYDETLFIITQMIYRDTEDSRLCGEQVAMFLRSGLLVTIQEDPKNDVFDPVRDRIRAGKGWMRKLGPDYLAYALLDAIVDHCFPILECLGDALEEIEDEVLDQPDASCLARLHEFRRSLVHLRRAVWPERDLINALLQDDSEIVSDKTKVFLRDCYDHAVRIMDLIESYRELTSALIELYLTSVGMRTNEIMRLLTVISAIFIPLTFIAGVYGMNFDSDGGKYPLNMPELHTPYGYIVCLFVMALTATGMVAFFRRKKWL